MRNPVLALLLPMLMVLSCAHQSAEEDHAVLNLELDVPLDTQEQNLLPDVWKLYQENKIFTAEATLEGFLKNQPNKLESLVLLGMLRDETLDSDAGSAWADVEALLVYQGKLETFVLEPTLFAAARHYLGLGREDRARLFLDELWRRYPNSDWSRKAQLQMAEAAVERQDWPRAASTCQDLLRMNGSGQIAERCRFIEVLSARMLELGPEPEAGAPVWVWEHPRPQGNTLFGAWAADDGELFVVGEKGTILHRAAGASAFTPMTSGTRWTLYAIHGSARTHVYAAGSAGTLLRFDGERWTEVRPADPVQGDLTAVYTAGTGHVTAASSTGHVIELRDGVWTEEHPTAEPLFGLWGHDVNHLFAVGKGGTLLRKVDGRWATLASDCYEDLRAVWGRSSTDVLAVGGNKTVVDFDGTTARETVAGLTGFHGVLGLADGSAFAVGERGNVIARLPGRAWMNELSATPMTLRGLAGRSAARLVAVGEGGTVIERGPKGWSLVAGGTRETLVAVALDQAGAVAALGESGTLLRHGPKGWRREVIGTTGRFRDLILAGKRLIAVGDHGLILEQSGKRWKPIPSGTAEDLLAAAAFSDGDFVAVGSRGVRLRVIGGRAVVDPPLAGQDLHGVSASGPSQIVAVGTRGSLVRFDGKRWTEQATGVLGDLYAVTRIGQTLMVVGSGGAILASDAEGPLRPMASPTSQALVDIHAGPDGSALALSARGAILAFDGKTWQVHHSPAACLSALGHHPTLGSIAVGCNLGVLRLPGK